MHNNETIAAVEVVPRPPSMLRIEKLTRDRVPRVEPEDALDWTEVVTWAEICN